ncbi:hypothetical protein F383_27661 [Gossypium arboreum]|nr:hypothetical protein F383_27661 [Gossypium arboreum]
MLKCCKLKCLNVVN